MSHVKNNKDNRPLRRCWQASILFTSPHAPHFWFSFPSWYFSFNSVSQNITSGAEGYFEVFAKRKQKKKEGGYFRNKLTFPQHLSGSLVYACVFFSHSNEGEQLTGSLSLCQHLNWIKSVSNLRTSCPCAVHYPLLVFFFFSFSQ